jgi:hypothetical protein
MFAAVCEEEEREKREFEKKKKKKKKIMMELLRRGSREIGDVLLRFCRFHEFVCVFHRPCTLLICRKYLKRSDLEWRIETTDCE